MFTLVVSDSGKPLINMTRIQSGADVAEVIDPIGKFKAVFLYRHCAVAAIPNFFAPPSFFRTAQVTKALCTAPNHGDTIEMQFVYVRLFVIRDNRMYKRLMAESGIMAWEPVNEGK